MGKNVWQSTKNFLSQRYVAGASRVRSAVIPAATSALAAVFAFWFASTVFGHKDPLFAATAAIICLGFGRDPQIRKVLEIWVGCTLGILVGDLILNMLGQGMISAPIVVFVSIIIARFLHSGVIFTTQMAIQSVLVVLLPLPDGGPFTRSIDAFVGGVIAIVITLMMPKNLHREPVAGLNQLYSTIAEAMRDCASGLRNNESRDAWMGLVSVRNTQETLDDLRKTIDDARIQATYSPSHRQSREVFNETMDTVEKTDLAIRSLRIVARRVVTVINESAANAETLRRMAGWFDEATEAIEILGRSLSEPAIPGRHRSLAVARDALGAATAKLDPAKLGTTTLHAEALVMLLRPMMVDFLEATGSSTEEANSYLPKL